MREMRRFYGKYRGKVANNVDPLQTGRIQVAVPEVLGDGLPSWAMPCVPFAGPGVGFFALPPVQANVWVEFEGGDPDFPIWSGCFWGPGEIPAQPPAPGVVVLQAAPQLKLELRQVPFSFTLEVGAAMKLLYSPAGIEISNGATSIKLTAAGVDINNGALEVLP
jgi:hypothetical protein